MGKWEMVPIPEIVFFQEGPGVRNTQYTSSGVKLLNVANLQDGKIDLSTSSRYISAEEAYGKYSHFLIDDGDFIIASSGIQVDYFEKKMGFINTSHLPLCMNTSTIRFKSLDTSKLDIRFFMYCLKTPQFKEQLKRQITGSAQLNFGPSHIKKMSVPLPPLPVQQQIADVLDRASALIEKRKAQIEKLDLLAKSQFIEMFGDPVTNPKRLATKKLSDISKLERGRFSPRPRNDPRYYNGEYPFIQTGDISSADYRLTRHAQTLNELGIKVSKKFKRNTIVMAIVGATIGMTAILQKDVYAPDSVVGITANSKCDNVFLEMVLRLWRPTLLSIAPESARANINLSILSNLDIICPSTDMQQQFCDFVRQSESQKFLFQQSFAKMEKNYKSLMQKCFRGDVF